MTSTPAAPPLPTADTLGVDPEPLGLRAEVLLARIAEAAVGSPK